MSNNPYQPPEAVNEAPADDLNPWACEHCGGDLDPSDKAAMRKLLWWNKCIHCNGKLKIMPEPKILALIIVIFFPLLILNYLTFASGIQIFGEFPSGIFHLLNFLLIVLGVFSGVQARRARYNKTGFKR